MFWDDEKKEKRSLGIRDKKILYERANHKCECCEKKIEFSEMVVGHKRAYSKGGATSLKNTVCLCYKCNNLQGTDSWDIFLKKLGKQPKSKKSDTKKRKKKTKKKKKKNDDDDEEWEIGGWLDL